MSPDSPESMVGNAGTLYGLYAYSLTLDNPVGLAYNGHTIETNSELAFDTPIMTRWEKFWWNTGRFFRTPLGRVVAVLLYVAAMALTFKFGGWGGALLFAAITGIGFGLGAWSAGVRARDGGDCFWEGVADFITNDWAMSMAMVSIMAITIVGMKFAVGAIKKLAALKKNGSGLVNAKTGKPLCFAEGTLVLCLDEDGKECHKPIEDISVGDLVWAYDEVSGEMDWMPVVQLFRNKSSDWTGVTIGGEEIISTPGHKYFLPDNTKRRELDEVHEHACYYGLSEKWVSAKHLKPGDKVLLASGEYGTIETVRDINYTEPQTTYNFEVEGYHTYFVGKTSVCVHNKGCPPGDDGFGRFSDGMELSVDDALSGAEEFLGPGYKEMSPGRFISQGGKGPKQVRIGPGEITGHNGGPPHLNFDIIRPRHKGIHIKIRGK